MLKYASDLPDDYEYGIIWWGQSNATANGSHTDGINEDPHLSLGSNPGANINIGIGSGSVGSETVDVDEVLTDGQYDGAELRVGRPDTILPGYGTVTSTYAPTSGTITSFTHGSDLATITGHGLQTGTKIIPTGSDIADPLVSGTTYFVIRLTSDTISFATTAANAATSTAITLTDNGSGTTTYISGSAITVTWVAAASAAVDVTAYTVFRDGRDRLYENVRVLTPYLPDQKGANRSGTPVAPGYVIPTTIADYDDLGVFLPFTFYEGMAGGGVNETDDFDGTFPGGSPPTSTAIAIDDTPDTFPDDTFNGGRIVVEHANGTSWGDVTDYESSSSVATFTVAGGWEGNGTPSSPTAMRVSFPYHTSNPHELSPGEGFLYPSNESQPLDAVKNVAAGNSSLGWGLRFGSVLSYASRIADQIGKRVNVINLAVDSSSILQTRTLTGSGTHGWWDVFLRSDWNPSTSNGLAARLEKMIVTMAPAALTAEGNTKELRILGIAGMQGETEAGTAAGRAQYKSLLPMFYNWLKKTVFDAGLSYYDAVDDMPVVHAKIRTTPWEDTGAAADTDGLVNKAIANFAAKTRFASTFDTDDSPLIVSDVHFDGEGEAINGKLAASALLQDIDDVLSLKDDLADPATISICNMALSYIGDVAKITSLDTAVDTSAQAVYCARFYTEAREILLQQMAWSFATKRTPLAVVTDARDEEWAYAYGYPNCAVRVFAVLPPDAGDDYMTGVNSTANVVDSVGAIRTRSFSDEVPLPFTIEQDDDGHRIIYTNTAGAIARYNTLVADASSYPPLFKNCLALKLASMLAGPIIRGAEGAKMTGVLLQMLELELGNAKKQDAVQSKTKIEHTPKSIKARW